jgi:hypothetical protein
MTTNNTSFNTNESLFYAPDGTLAYKWVLRCRTKLLL